MHHVMAMQPGVEDRVFRLEPLSGLPVGEEVPWVRHARDCGARSAAVAAQGCDVEGVELHVGKGAERPITLVSKRP